MNSKKILVLGLAVVACSAVFARPCGGGFHHGGFHHGGYHHGLHGHHHGWHHGWGWGVGGFAAGVVAGSLARGYYGYPGY